MHRVEINILIHWCVSEPCLEFERLILPPAKPFLSPSSAGPGPAVKVVVAIMSGRSSLKLGTAAESSRKLVLEALGVERARVFFRPPLTWSPSVSKRCEMHSVRVYI